MEISIEWDSRKNKSNQEKHGFCFEDAGVVFCDEVFTFEDNRYDYGEKRYIAFGNLEGRAVIIAYTYRNDKIRIISMRKANEREKKTYQKRLEENRCS